jgi:ATP-dependent protease HslVU (ClpYQ) peptidase subunit
MPDGILGGFFIEGVDMTTIVAVQYTDKVVFAADNQVTGDNGRIYHHPRMEKITERGEYLIAGSGEIGPCDIAQHIWQPPKPTLKDRQDIYHFMITKVMPHLRQCLTDNGYDFNEGKGDGKVNDSRFNFLIAIGGEVFDVADDCSICMSDDGIYGVGSGSSYAIGALHAGAKPLKALEIAAQLDANTSAPFLVKEQYK